MGRIFAAADIGSNTVHMLIAETDGVALARITNQSEWISLGEKVARTGTITPPVEVHLIKQLKDFKRLARASGAEYVYLFATEAMRAADNHDEVLERIRLSTDLVVDLISPQREAELSIRGVSLDSPSDVDMVLEVGGGSAQVARVQAGKLVQDVSVAIGTGRIIADAGLKSPCLQSHAAGAHRLIHDRLESVELPIVPHAKRVVASGGVIRGLWRALHPDGDRVLHRPELAYMEWASSHLSVPQIVARFNVKNKRAATLLPGALVYGGLMDRLEITDVHVSEFGVREGAILEIARGSIQGCLV